MLLPIIDFFRYKKKPSRLILTLCILIGSLFALKTQTTIGNRVLQDCKIEDILQTWTTPFNSFFASHDAIADKLMALYSIIGDAIVLFFVFLSIYRSSIKPMLPLIVFMVLRQVMQLLVSFPVDQDLIWQNPGIVSLFQNYPKGGDFYFSAYAGIMLLWTLEIHDILKNVNVTVFNSILTALMILLDVSLRSHYTLDIYTSIVTALFCFIFIDPFCGWADKKLKKIDQVSHFYLIFGFCVLLATFFTTQYFITQKQAPTCGILDNIQNVLLPINRWIDSFPSLENAILIVMNLLIDAIFAFIIFETIFRKNIRPFLTLALFFALRQTIQLTVNLPIPEFIIWHDPGFPSLLQNYGITNDLYFSGHAGISLIGALELMSFRKKWLTMIGFFIFGLESFLVLTLQMHYTMDVFTAIITVFCITDFSCHLSHPLNRFLAKLHSS
jgi:hypothetical protein